MTMPRHHHRDPKTQPQIGEAVTYLTEGVITKVTGYEWENPTGDINHAPRIKRYVLGCGVTVHADHIAQIEPEEPEPEQARNTGIVGPDNKDMHAEATPEDEKRFADAVARAKSDRPGGRAPDAALR